MIFLPYAVFEVTAECPLACRFCYNFHKAPGAAAPPPSGYASSLRVLRELYSRAEVGTLVMSGGEPFLAERFAELVLFCRMKGSRVKILSGGCSAGREEYRQLMEMGEVFFQFPVHSADPGVHDALTGVTGSWERSLRSIREVQDMGGDPFAVTVLTAFNREGAADLFDLLMDRGVKRVLLLRYKIGGTGAADPAGLVIKVDSLRSVLAAAQEYASAGRLVITSNVCTPLCLIAPADYPAVGFTHCSDDLRKLPVTLDSAGNIRRCNHSPLAEGNLFRDGLEAYFASARPEWNVRPDYCAGCDRYAACLGGCRAASLQYYGTLARPDPYVEFCR